MGTHRSSSHRLMAIEIWFLFFCVTDTGAAKRKVRLIGGAGGGCVRYEESANETLVKMDNEEEMRRREGMGRIGEINKTALTLCSSRYG